MVQRLRPSPAMIVAFVSLFVALGGTAYSAGMIEGGSIKDHTVAGRKMVDNTLTGRQIRESALGKVPVSADARRVDGVIVRKILYAPAAPTSSFTKILSLGGLTFRAQCSGDADVGTVTIEVRSGVDNASFFSQFRNSAGSGGLHHADFDATSLDDLTDGNPWGETSFTYTRPNHTIVSGEVSFASSDQISDGTIFDGAAKCLVSGFAMSTAA